MSLRPAKRSAVAASRDGCDRTRASRPLVASLVARWLLRKRAAFVLARSYRCRGSPGWTRTNNPSVNSRMLCQLSYRGSLQRAIVARSVPACRSRPEVPGSVVSGRAVRSNGYCSGDEPDCDRPPGSPRSRSWPLRVAAVSRALRRRRASACGNGSAARRKTNLRVVHPGSRGVRPLGRARPRGAADDRRAGREAPLALRDASRTMTVRRSVDVFGLIGATSSMFFSSW